MGGAIVVQVDEDLGGACVGVFERIRKGTRTLDSTRGSSGIGLCRHA